MPFRHPSVNNAIQPDTASRPTHASSADSRPLTTSNAAASSAHTRSRPASLRPRSGRADGGADVGGDAPESGWASGLAAEHDDNDESDADALAAEALRDELQGLRLKQLRQRASAEGLDADTVGDVLDADNPKAALIALLVEHVSRRGPAEQMLSALEVGGEACAEMLSGVLDHAMEVVEELSTSSPRKARRSLRELLDRIEAVGESMDEDWCDGMSGCGREELDQLSGLLIVVSGLSISCDAAEVSGGVSGLLRCLDRCGSVVVQSVCALRDGKDSVGNRSDCAVVGALESLRGLGEERLEFVCADEATAFELVMARLSGFETISGSLEVLISSCMAVYTLVCRNGTAIRAASELSGAELAGKWFAAWAIHVSDATVTSDVELLAGAASSVMWDALMECTFKTPSEFRAPHEAGTVVSMKQVFGTTKDMTAQRVCDVLRAGAKAGVWTHADLRLSCGWSTACQLLLYMHPDALPAADDAGVFRAALTLLGRVEPMPLPAEWWLSTHNVVDALSVRLMGPWFPVGLVRRLPGATQAPWFQEWLGHSIRMVKLNASAGLSGRDMGAFQVIMYSLAVVEVAAKDESQHEKLVESGMMDALEYGILNDMTVTGGSTA
eukprot:COSAG06_NODE_5503_length_3439_cov_24.252395_1_plen_613_part_10